MDVIMPLDIMIIIFDLLDILHQLRFRSINKLYLKKCLITNLTDCTKTKNITNKILKQYPNITKLNLSLNSKISKFPSLSELKELDISAHHIIPSFDIHGDELNKLSNLTLLKIDNNFKMGYMNLNPLINLRILHATGQCEIRNESISQLTNLTELYVCGNPYITNLNYLTNLQTLGIGYYRTNNATDFCSKIGDKGIQSLTKLRTLYAYDNVNINKISHLTKLRILDAGGKCAIDNEQISFSTNLKTLYVHNNTDIKNINSLINLRILGAGGKSSIDNNSILLLTNLTELYVCGNSNIIWKKNYFPNLRIWNTETDNANILSKNLGKVRDMVIYSRTKPAILYNNDHLNNCKSCSGYYFEKEEEYANYVIAIEKESRYNSYEKEVEENYYYEHNSEEIDDDDYDFNDSS